MKYLLLTLFLFLFNYTFSQSQDSIPESNMEAFFGCQCCADTIAENAGKKNQYECILVKTELMLTGKKNGKIIWKINLNNIIQKEESTYVCLRSGHGKHANKLLVYNNKRVVMFISVKNGKQVKFPRQSIPAD